MIRETYYFSTILRLNRITSPMQTSPENIEKATSTIHLKNNENKSDERTKKILFTSTINDEG